MASSNGPLFQQTWGSFHVDYTTLDSNNPAGGDRKGLTNERSAEDIRYFGQQPYWTEGQALRVAKAAEMISRGITLSE